MIVSRCWAVLGGVAWWVGRYAKSEKLENSEKLEKSEKPEKSESIMTLQPKKACHSEIIP